MQDRRRRPPSRRGGPQGRRTPPAATGREAEYLKVVKEARTPMVLYLVDGRRVEGVIEYFDREMVKVTRPEGPHFFVRKSDIRYMHEES